MGEGIFASQRGEAQRGHQSSSFGFGEDTAKVCDRGARNPVSEPNSARNSPARMASGASNKKRQGVDFSEGIRTKVAQPLQRVGVKRDRVLDLMAVIACWSGSKENCVCIFSFEAGLC